VIEYVVSPKYKNEIISKLPKEYLDKIEAEQASA